jgi:hypothetical protein
MPSYNAFSSDSSGRHAKVMEKRKEDFTKHKAFRKKQHDDRVKLMNSMYEENEKFMEKQESLKNALKPGDKKGRINLHKKLKAERKIFRQKMKTKRKSENERIKKVRKEFMVKFKAERKAFVETMKKEKKHKKK